MGLFSSIAHLGGSILSGVTGALGHVGSFLGGAAGGAAADLFDSGLDLGMSQYSAHQAFKQQKELMKYQHDLNLDSFGQRHQLEVKDLRASGLNPILSANSGGSVAGAGLNSALSLANESARVSESNRASSADKLNRAMLETQLTQQMLNRAQVYGTNARASADLSNADANLIRARADASLANARARNELLYPPNQPTLFKYLNSSKSLFSDYIKTIPVGNSGTD